MAARNLVRVGIKLCISFFFLMLSYVVLILLQRYRFFIERWGQKGLRDLRWNRRGRWRKGCYFKIGGSGVVPII
nr:MAG TPA: hypothetical protein [Caudoviricetes sp.]